MKKIKIKKEILVTPTTFTKCGNQPLNLLKRAGYKVILNPFGRKMTPEEVIKFGQGCMGIILGNEKLDERVLKFLPNLKCVSRSGVGIDNIDLNKARDLEIVVRNTPKAPTKAVAELTVGVIFDLLRQISFMDREIRRGNWIGKMGGLLQDKKVGILGVGRIGRRVAELLLGLGVKVVGADIKPKKQWFKKHKVPLLKLKKLLQESDILSIHIPLSEENRHFVGRQELNFMKRGSYLINLARGGAVDEKALCTALKNGHLAGAAIDTFEQEPYWGSLIKFDNVVLTPHAGSYTAEARLKMAIEAAKNIIEVLKHKKYESTQKTKTYNL